MRRTETQTLTVATSGLVLGALVVIGAGAVTGLRAQDGGRSSSRHASITEGLDCANCHTTSGWSMAEGASAGHGFDHGRTGFPLTARHGLATCAQCHRRELEIRRECVSCHEGDHHEGRLGRDCDRCHTATGWNDTSTLELHRRTRLPLTGMHALADCTECHGRLDEREHTAPPADCYACHENDYRRADVHPVHAGTATTDPFPRDCGLCHVATGWSPALFDPSTLAAIVAPLTAAPPEHEALFPIRRGAHRDAPCSSCHVVPDMPRILECTGCHVHDPVTLQRQHAGMTVSPDAASCLGCHPGGVGR